jgi:hypothetical protein
MIDEPKFRASLNFMILRCIGGGLLATLKPTDPFLLGGTYLRRSDRIFTDIEPLRKQAVNKLNSVGVEDLKVGFSELGQPQTEAWKKWVYEKRQEVKEQFSYVQGWLGLQFVPEKYVANYDYWAKAGFFTMEEAVWLSLGLEPLTELDKMLNAGSLKRAEDIDACETVRAQFKLFKRALDPYGFESKFQARDVLNWINQVDLDVHSGYRNMLQRMVDRVSKDEANTETIESQGSDKPERFEGREKVSLAKLLLAMAITEYGYDPTARRSPIPREMQDIAASLGLEVSQDTIRHYLQLGARHLPSDWKPD